MASKKGRRRSDKARSQALSKRKQNIVASAIRVVATRPDGIDAQKLSEVLERANNFPRTEIYGLLCSEPRLLVANGIVRLAPTQSARSTANRPVTNPTDRLRLDLLTRLNDLATDSLRISCPVPTGTLRLRCDPVLLDIEQLWIAASADPATMALVLTSKARTPGPGWALPLVPGTPASQILVWQITTTEEAADNLLSLLTRAGADQSRARLTSMECTPAELDRRHITTTTLNRLVNRTSRRNPVSSCDRCGHPLSDPESVRIGIGPDCRKYYAPEVLTALTHRTRLPRRTALKPKQLLTDLRGWVVQPSTRA